MNSSKSLGACLLAALILPACGGGSDDAPGPVVVLWPQSNPQNVVVSAAAQNQELPEVVTDGAGGVIVVWRDSRSGNFDIYAQRMSAAGAAMWTPNGVAVCAAAGDQDYPQIATDGAGGAILVWQDNRSGTLDIYAQRLNAAGVPQWTADGVAVCSVAGLQELPRIVSDGSGGAILGWRDLRSGFDIHLYAQRINGAGTAQWTAGGVAVCTAFNAGPASPRIASDAANGAIFVWDDLRVPGDFNLFAQRMDNVGAAQWTANGVSISSAASTQTRAWIVPDGSGGAVMAWADSRNGNLDIFAQRVNAAGIAQWTVDGVPVCAATANQDFTQMISDGSGGAILVWEDARFGASNKDIFAQRLNGSGTAQWTADGVGICLAVANQSLAQIISDGAGGAVVAWEDLRAAPYDVYAQRVSGTGIVQWTADGVAVSTATGPQQDTRIVPDGSGGAILVWRDARSGVDVYAQKLTGSGQQ